MQKKILLTTTLSILLFSLILCEILFGKNIIDNKYNSLDKYAVLDKKVMTYGENKIEKHYNSKYSYILSYPLVENNSINDQIKTFLTDKKNKIKQNNSYEIMTINYESYLKENYISITFITKYIKKNTTEINSFIYDKNSGIEIKNIFKEETINETKELLNTDIINVALSNENLINYRLVNNNYEKTFINYSDISNYLNLTIPTITNNIDRQTIRNIDPNKPMVALTFDDGPHPIYGPAIINTLKKYNSVATFFEVGYMLKNYSYVSLEAKKIGCEIGSHTYNHVNLKKLKTNKIKEDFQAMDDLYYSIFNEYPKYIRPPYGAYNDNVTNNTDEIFILWSIDTLDWKTRNAERIVESIKKEGDLNGDVILMHSLYKETAEALEILIPWLLEQEYQLVTISELLENKYNQNIGDQKVFGYYYFGL